MQLMMSQPPVDLSSPVTPTAVFDPPVVRPGEQAIYRVTFNALEESIDWPDHIQAPAELELRPGARAQTLQNAGSIIKPFTLFNTRVRASSAGVFTVPEFVVQVNTNPVTVPAARLEVSATAQTTPRAGRLVVELAMTNPFVGQPIPARVLLLGSEGGAVQSLQQVQLTGQGFITDPTSVRQRIERMNRDGVNLAVYVYETTLTPISAGKIELFGQALTSGLRFMGPVVIQGSGIQISGGPTLTLLESEPVALEPRPMPTEGELPGFTGGIGNFAVGIPKLGTNIVRVGEPVRLAVTVQSRGEGNMARLVPPPPPRSREWEIFPAATTGVSSISATFNYTLIALTEGARSTPPIPFSYFDPSPGAYADLTIPAVALTVRAGAAAPEAQALLQTNWAQVETESEPTLSGLATAPGLSAQSLVPLQQQTWFPFVQAAPAALLFALWGWDRRRRYLDLHPDILVRRRARRALRRQRRAIQLAVLKGDAPGFAAAAVSALRIACAPHFPAEPQALVGGDLLRILTRPVDEAADLPTGFGVRQSSAAFSAYGSETRKRQRTAALQDAGARPSALPVPVTDLVRRFFAVADASRFATTPADATQLLVLQPQLEEVLQQLEESL
jgi:hypothetical protein